MCGIAGFFTHRGGLDEGVLKKMGDTIAYRGPDDSGTWFEASERGSVGFAHRRLSILDLSKLGHQPMHYEHLTIAFNGEVYNFREIREELERAGYRFESHTDTEVILKAFHRWGADS